MSRGKHVAIANKAGSSDAKSGQGSGRMGAKRHHYKIHNGASALNKPSLRRLARRAGVKRMNAGVYDEAPLALRAWLSKMVVDACTLAEYGRRFTVTLNDILLALKRNGVTLYGFAMTEKRRRLTRPLQRKSLVSAAARVAIRAASPPQETTPTAAAAVSGAAVRASKAKAPASKPAVSPTDPVTPERAQDIQASLSAFRDTVIARQASSDAPVPRVAEWVAAHLRGRGKPACSMAELEVVLEALSEQDAVMVTDDEAQRARTVWFV